MKKENKKINRDNLLEVQGSRAELEKYLGQEFEVNAFITNTYGYLDQKRLVTEIEVKEFFINHAWFRTEKIGNLKHGYQKLRVEVTKYKDQQTKEYKYGLKYTGAKGKKRVNNTLIRPKWMSDE